MVEYSGEILDTMLKTKISHDSNFHTNISQSICEFEVSHRTDIDPKFFSFALFNLQQSALRLSGIREIFDQFRTLWKREKGEMNFDT